MAHADGLVVVVSEALSLLPGESSFSSDKIPLSIHDNDEDVNVWKDSSKTMGSLACKRLKAAMAETMLVVGEGIFIMGSFRPWLQYKNSGENEYSVNLAYLGVAVSIQIVVDSKLEVPERVEQAPKLQL